MTAENFEVVLNTLVDKRPFTVFTVELNSGQRVEIDHPKAMVIREGVAVFIGPGGIPAWFDHDSVLQIIGAPAGKQA